jgi:hypothetical protein
MPVFFITCKKEPGPGDPVDIPKGRFYDVLVELGVDVNGDGSISYAEAEKVTVLLIPGRGLSTLIGIEVFANLESLWCQENQLSTLDISKNVLLRDLNCSSN